MACTAINIPLAGRCRARADPSPQKSDLLQLAGEQRRSHAVYDGHHDSGFATPEYPIVGSPWRGSKHDGRLEFPLGSSSMVASRDVLVSVRRR
jgi:hypothetical protein